MRLSYLFKASLVALSVLGLCDGAYARKRYNTEEIGAAYKELNGAFQGLADDLNAGLDVLKDHTCAAYLEMKKLYEKECAGILKGEPLMEQLRKQFPNTDEATFQASSAVVELAGSLLFEKCQGIEKSVHKLEATCAK